MITFPFQVIFKFRAELALAFFRIGLRMRMIRYQGRIDCGISTSLFTFLNCCLGEQGWMAGGDSQ